MSENQLAGSRQPAAGDLHHVAAQLMSGDHLPRQSTDFNDPPRQMRRLA